MITILMATYQGAAYLAQQIDSILSQTYWDWQLFISDDLSSDNTREIIAGYTNQYPKKIFEWKNQTASGGAEFHFFKMISRLKDAQYVAFCDQDDIWLPNKLMDTFKKMQQLETQLGNNTPILVHSDLKVVDKDLNIIHNSFFSFQNISPERTKLRHYLVQNNITGCTMLINQSLLQKIDYIPSVCTMHDWWIALIASCFGKIDVVSKPLVLYRQHQNNQVGAKNAHSASFLLNKFRNRKVVQQNYQKMFAQAQLFLQHYRAQLSTEQIHILEEFLKIPHQNRFKKAQIIIQNQFYKNSFARTLGQFFSI